MIFLYKIKFWQFRNIFFSKPKNLFRFIQMKILKIIFKPIKKNYENFENIFKTKLKLHHLSARSFS